MAACHGHPRQTYRSRLALAERVRRKTDRIDPTRVRRPCDRLGRGVPPRDFFDTHDKTSLGAPTADLPSLKQMAALTRSTVVNAAAQPTHIFLGQPALAPEVFGLGCQRRRSMTSQSEIIAGAAAKI